MNLTAQDFLTVFQRLLPRGRIWPREPNSTQAKALLGLMPQFERLIARDNNLLIDAFPVAPVELLPEWEETLGLPDPCAGEAATLQQRQMQVAARFVAQGGQTAAYFTDVAATLGYQITIQLFAPSRFGMRFGQPFAGEDWAYAWQIDAPSFSIQRFTFGRDDFGEPFASWGNTVLQCEMQRLKPAHTILLFSYGGQSPVSGS